MLGSGILGVDIMGVDIVHGPTLTQQPCKSML